MRRLAAPIVAFAVIAASCSSGNGQSAPDTTPQPTNPTQADSTTALTDATGAATMVSASEGGTVTFGNDVDLVIPAGALDTDTEISIASVPRSEWPDELAGLDETEFAIDVLRLSPDGLVFNEPATLSRHNTAVGEPGPGDTLLRPSLALSRTSAEWTALGLNITLDDDGITVQTPISHFSDNVLLVGKSRVMVRFNLNPSDVERFVGTHFMAQLGVDVRMGTVDTQFWSAGFDVDSGPLVLGQPSIYSVQNASTQSRETGISGTTEELIAPAGTPMPRRFPAAYNCVAAGQATFSGHASLIVSPGEEMMDAILQALRMNITEVSDPDNNLAGQISVSATLRGDASCVDRPEDLTAGVVDINSKISSDPAGHACCVKDPPEKARMTLGSLWFTDAKLGNSTQWQGLFFDPEPGSSDDVMLPANDSTLPRPSTVQIILDPDFDVTGHFVADGTGVVAGFPGIRVVLDATATDRGTWSGTLTKGVDGGLPTGQPIIYDISGSLIAPQPIAFVEQLAQAFRDADSEFLLEHLHPDVIGLYAGTCIDFVNGVSSPDLNIDVHSITDVADWTLTLDNHDLTITDAISLDVSRTENGVTSRTVMHVAPRPTDGPPSEMTWFADCGEPIPTP